MAGTLLGIDIGSSSIKASLLDADSGRVIAQATSPQTELEIVAPRPDWAEQHPETWWEHAKRAVSAIGATKAKELQALRAIGIAYQMHGLVLVDSQGTPLRPAIIWCDSRAVDIGARAFASLGQKECLARLGNSPGNFTASKLAWVKENEPDVIERAACFMLPGDYIAFRLSGKFGTTPSGLSEGVLWDYLDNAPALHVLDHFGLRRDLVPAVSGNLGAFAGVRGEVARELGIPEGTPVSYRAGDQPNNALALNVLSPGEIAANAGTSGVVYGVTAGLGIDSRSRVNNFLHVNNSPRDPRIGVLMCVNGAGSFYRWVRHTLAGGRSYAEMNSLAKGVPTGSRGLVALPYGNGAERTLGNVSIGASLESLELNRHGPGEIFRAAQEGVVFALCYGVEIMRAMGLTPTTVRAGNANMFQSDVFRESFATASNAPLELLTTDGSEGAARGAGIGAGIFSFADAFRGVTPEVVIEPNAALRGETISAYERWKEALHKHLSR